MKMITFAFIILTTYSLSQAQGPKRNWCGGSWINANLAEYYESGDEHPCGDIKYFDNDKFVPLYFSFTNEKKLRITSRIEQKLFSTYFIISSGSDSIVISNGTKKTRTIYLYGELLKLRYDNNLLVFRKVSDIYSTDVFGEFIKQKLFKKYKRFKISFSKSGNKSDIEFTRFNVKQNLIKIFKCKSVDFVQLGSQKFKGLCLPQVALYGDEKTSEGLAYLE